MYSCIYDTWQNSVKKLYVQHYYTERIQNRPNKDKVMTETKSSSKSDSKPTENVKCHRPVNF